MDGAGLAAQQLYDNNVALAWHTAAFNGAVQVGKLKSLAEYQSASEPRKPQSPADLLAAFRDFAERGAPMTIRKLN